MSMTPREIHEKHFHDAFRGYNHEEVDSFLDEVAEAFERLYRDNQNLLRRVAELQEQSNRAPEDGVAAAQPREIEQDDLVNESLLKRMLVMAQETADKAVTEARQRANTLVENAQGRASQIEEQARERAERMIGDAERKLTELEESAIESRRRLERAQEGLRRFDEEYRTQFKAFIESQLAALDHLPSSPEPAAAVLPQPAPPAPVLPSITEDRLPEGVGGLETPSAGEPPEAQTEIQQSAAGKDEGPEESVGASVASPRQEPPQRSADGNDQGRGQKGSSKADEGDEDRLIRELFWGEE